MFKKGEKVSWKVKGYPDADGVVFEDEIEGTEVTWIETFPKPGDGEGGSLIQVDSGALKRLSNGQGG